MALPNIFSKDVSDQLIKRINQLTPSTQPKWGKMNVAQMLAHCNVTYEITFENTHPKPGKFKQAILKLLVKKGVVNDVPYKQNSPTAPVFKVASQQDFEKQKERLIAYLNKAVDLGENTFDGKEYPNFGVLNKQEWSNMFYKHLNHHLTQFGV